MDDNQIQYDEERYAPSRRKEGEGLSGLIMRMGLAKDKKQASVVLAAVVLACAALGIGAWFIL